MLARYLVAAAAVIFLCGCGSGDSQSTASNDGQQDNNPSQPGVDPSQAPRLAAVGDGGPPPDAGVDPDAADNSGGNADDADTTDDDGDNAPDTADNADDTDDGDGSGTETIDIPALIQQANSLMQSNPAAAIPSLETVLEQEPENRQALFLLGVATQLKGIELAQRDRMSGNPMLLRSAEVMEQLNALGNLNPTEATWYAQAIYNEACCLAIMGRTDEAIASFEKAVEAGFEDLAQIEIDADFESLRDEEAFQQIVANLRETMAGRAVEAATERLASFESYPFSFELPNLAGEMISLDQYKGKVVIVDFWGTWCPPCRQEIPHFLALYDKYQEQGFEMVGLNYERVPEDQVNETISNFNADEGVDYPCLIGDDATRAQVPDFQGYPTTLFIDREGNVRAQLVGYHEYADLEGLILALLNEGGAADADDAAGDDAAGDDATGDDAAGDDAAGDDATGDDGAGDDGAGDDGAGDDGAGGDRQDD